MSYARMGCDDSDVYVYCPGGVPDGEWWVVCCHCRMLDEAHSDEEEVILKSIDAALRHLARHLAAQHNVPHYVFSRIRDEASDMGDHWP